MSSASADDVEGKRPHRDRRDSHVPAGRAALVMPFVAATRARQSGLPAVWSGAAVLGWCTASSGLTAIFVERTVKLLALASVWAYLSAGVAYLPVDVLPLPLGRITPWRSTCPFS